MKTNELTERYHQLWVDILKTKRVEKNEDFFDLGGTSLSLIELMSQTKERFSVELNIGDFENGLTLEIYENIMSKSLAKS